MTQAPGASNLAVHMPRLNKQSCAYCAPGIAHRTLCPRTGEVCRWCCDKCRDVGCARDLMITRYPAAERIACDLTLSDAPELSQCADEWRRVYVGAYRHSPGGAEQSAARAILKQRIEFVLPPPPCAAWTSQILPKLTVL